jgi:hypothetical protein
VVLWLVEPCIRHPDDEELLDTGIQSDDDESVVSESDDGDDDDGEDSGTLIDGEGAQVPVPGSARKAKEKKKKSAVETATKETISETTAQTFAGWKESDKHTKVCPDFEPYEDFVGLRPGVFAGRPKTVAEGIWYICMHLLPFLTF